MCYMFPISQEMVIQAQSQLKNGKSSANDFGLLVSVSYVINFKSMLEDTSKMIYPYINLKKDMISFRKG